MSKLDRCPEMERIPRALRLDQPIPKSLVAHASGCKHCLFWLSYSFAIKRAFLTTNRTRSARCPERMDFNRALMTAARSIKTTHGPIDKHSMRNLRHVSWEEFEEAQTFCEHLNNCGLCQVYWEQLNDAVISVQQEYEALIKEGHEIRPVIADTAYEHDILSINFVPNPSPSQRPN